MKETKKQWSYNDFVRLLGRNGYTLNRSKGSHAIFTNGAGHISVPRLKQNPMLIRRLIKENKLA